MKKCVVLWASQKKKKDKETTKVVEDELDCLDDFEGVWGYLLEEAKQIFSILNREKGEFWASQKKRDEETTKVVEDELDCLKDFEGVGCTNTKRERKMLYAATSWGSQI